MTSNFTFRNTVRHAATAITICMALSAMALQAAVLQLPYPSIIAGANSFPGNAYNVGGFAAGNLFDGNSGTEYSSNSQGVGTLYSTLVTNGTWLHFNFGTPIRINTLRLQNRNNVDYIDTIRLTANNTGVFSGADQFVDININNATIGPYDYSFPDLNGQHLRFEAIAANNPGNGNFGGREMSFSANRFALPDPTIYDGAPWFQNVPINGTPGQYSELNVFDNNAATEYASTGAGTGTFLDFDFGTAQFISGFDHTQRFAQIDVITTSNLIFASDAAFTNILGTVAVTHTNAPNGLTEVAFPGVLARYVRWDVTGVDTAGNNAGAQEIVFYTSVPEPSSLAMLLFGTAMMFFFRKRGK